MPLESTLGDTQTYKKEIFDRILESKKKDFVEACQELTTVNDCNGHWLPTSLRLQASKVLLSFKAEEKFLSI
jgi:hypothetical protein